MGRLDVAPFLRRPRGLLFLEISCQIEILSNMIKSFFKQIHDCPSFPLCWEPGFRWPAEELPRRGRPPRREVFLRQRNAMLMAGKRGSANGLPDPYLQSLSDLKHFVNETFCGCLFLRRWGRMFAQCRGVWKVENASPVRGGTCYVAGQRRAGDRRLASRR